MRLINKIVLTLFIMLSLVACSQVSHQSIEYWRSPASIVGGNCQSAISQLARKASFESDSLEINGSVRHWESVGDDAVIALKGGRDIHSAIETIITKAKKQIYIQMSAINDPKIIDLLVSKAEQGLDVKLVISDITKQLKNAEAKAVNLKYLDSLKEAGVDVQVFSNEQLVRQSDQYSPENHRKLIVVDSEVGYIGSANINSYTDNYDLGVLVNKNLAKELNNFFVNDFSYSSARRLRDFERFVVGAKNSKFQYLHGKELRSAMLQRIDKAESSIDIAIYDFKDDALIDALILKKNENPNFEINVVLGPEWKHRTWKGRDISPPQNEKAFHKLSKAKINVKWAGDHLKETESIVHAKAMIVDRKYVFGGSSDFNIRSFEGNQELNFELDSTVLASEFSDSIRREAYAGSNKIVHTRMDLFRGMMIEKATEFMAFLRSGKRHFVDKIVWHPAYLRLKLRKFSGKFVKITSKFKKAKDRNIVNSNPVAARARFYKVVSRLKTSKGKKLKVIKEERFASELEAKNTKYFFAGYHTRGFEDIQDQGFVPTSGGYYGDGVYVATSPETAIDYSLSRAFQEKKSKSSAHVLLIKARMDKVFIPEKDMHLFEKWLADRGDEYSTLSEEELMDKFLKTNDYNAIRVVGAEGPKADYFLFLNSKDLSIVNQFQLE